MKKLKQITLKKTEGKKLIKDASDVFTSWIDSDFKNYGLTQQESTQKAVICDIYEMDSDATFKQLFTDPENQWMTQEEVIQFYTDHTDDLRQDGYGTFFLLKKDTDFFVAIVDFDGGGRLCVYVYKFSDGRVWDAEGRHRIVVPQRSLKTLESESLSSSESLTLKSAIKICKENGLTVTKIY